MSAWIEQNTGGGCWVSGTDLGNGRYILIGLDVITIMEGRCEEWFYGEDYTEQEKEALETLFLDEGPITDEECAAKAEAFCRKHATQQVPYEAMLPALRARFWLPKVTA